MGDDEWTDEEELEYERLVESIFRAGEDVAEPFEFLGGGGEAGVAWLNPAAVAKLHAVEAEVGLLASLSTQMQARGDLLGRDVAELRRLLERCAATGTAFYYWEPGT